MSLKRRLLGPLQHLTALIPAQRLPSWWPAAARKRSTAEKSLCDWTKYDIKNNFDELCRLTESPRFSCLKCARSAHRAGNLCQPKARGPVKS